MAAAGDDRDTQMLELTGAAIIELQTKYRRSDLEARIAIRPALEDMLREYTRYEMRLLAEGVISSEDELAQMQQIKAEIDAAATRQTIIAGIARLAGFVAARV